MKKTLLIILLLIIAHNLNLDQKVIIPDWYTDKGELYEDDYKLYVVPDDESLRQFDELPNESFDNEYLEVMLRAYLRSRIAHE
jgi:hypothetical protein